MQELPVTAYLDRFSARPGETLALQSSLRQPGPCQVSLVRIVCADPNPAGPGLDIRDLSRIFQARFQGRHQPLHPGSFGVVEGALALPPLTTWTAWVWPTLDREREQTVLAGTGERGAVELAVAADGAVLTVRDGRGAATRLATGRRRGHSNRAGWRIPAPSSLARVLMDWRQRPRDYAAVHFHEDGVGDCGWETDLHVTVPADLPSGVYGLKLDVDGASDTVPFFVLPPRRGPRAAMVYLAATFTYQAYANHGISRRTAICWPGWRRRITRWT